MSSGLDPVVEKAMEVALELSNQTMLHPNDAERWMSLFPALVAAGYSWDMDDIGDWLERNWASTMANRGAAKVYAWADMAQEQHKRRTWAENLIQRWQTELTPER